MGAFSIFENKKKRKKYNAVPTVEEYYLRLARRATFTKFIIIIAIAGFALFSFSNYKEELKIDNFRYMLKFADFGADTVEEAAASVYFDSDTTNKGEFLRGDIAVLNTSGFSVYGFNGDRLLKEPFKYDHPKMVSNSKNIIVGDLGGYELQIFNSYSVIYKETFEYPIYGISTNENGEFAVISSKENYQSAFFVYDEYYREIYNYSFGDKYIDFISVSPDGKEVLTLLHYTKDGELVTVLMKFSVNENESSFQYEFIDELPLGVNYMADGSYAVITNEALRFFSSDNQIINEIFFKEKSLLGFEINENYAIITYNTVGLSAGTELEVYKKDGTLVAVRNYKSALLDKKVSSDTLYVLLHGSLSEIDLTGKNEDKTSEVESEFRQLILNETSVILFSDSKAEYFSGNEDKSAESAIDVAVTE